MSQRDGKHLRLDGAVTIETAAAVLDEAARAVRDGIEVVDFGAVSEVDSAAVAVALALVREARGAGRPLAFANVPSSLANLARLYAVADFIPVAGR